ncbi:MAG: sugar phosphorylase [Planctomycetota bacterium]
MNAPPIEKLNKHLANLYPGKDTSQLAQKLVDAFAEVDVEPRRSWSHRDVFLISYGDSILDDGREPLQALNQFLDEFVGEAISTIHLLPFFPFTSDDGFAVSDYQNVRPDLGEWTDVAGIGKRYRLMFDLVINHCSASHAWFEQFRRDEKPGKDYFIDVNPVIDLSDVTRPRATPLLRPTATPSGQRHVWCTFGHDQVDLNFENPDVLVEMVGVVADYIIRGASVIRLDAVGYLWKRIGTSCIHLPETHEVVRLLRTLIDHFAPGSILITETNVPSNENLSYFGNRNEAQMIYNFSLAPLVLHALLSGKATYLQKWMRSMPPGPVGCTYLNFTASHDGIGMRPAEGLIPDDEQERVVSTVKDHGGLVSSRKMSDGTERVYELNISLFDAFRGTFSGVDQWQVERFLCSQIIAMGVEGIPAVYIHSLLATPNDIAGVRQTGRNRSINRHQWQMDELRSCLEDPSHPTARVRAELVRLLDIRCKQPAFSPDATQFTLILPENLFGFWRQSTDRSQSIFAVHNLTGQSQTIAMEDLNLISTETWYDLISGDAMPGLVGEVELKPYQCVWISNPRDE